jgi:hypothetical protein
MPSLQRITRSLAALLVIGVALSSPPALAQVWQASTDYSTTQGDRNWRYLCFRTSDSSYGTMVYGNDIYGYESWYGLDELGQGTASAIFASYVRPTVSPIGAGYEPARVWESPLAGTVRVTGTVAEADTSTRDPILLPDGIQATIWKNSELLFVANIGDSDFVGYSYDITVDVMPGDWLVFRVGSNSNPNYDWTYFDPRITVTSLTGSSESSWITDVLSELSAYVTQLDSSLFSGPVEPARIAHRMSLAHELQVASNLTASGEFYAASQSLANAFWRLDGDPSPPDWMVDSPQKAALRDEAWVLVALLRGL